MKIITDILKIKMEGFKNNTSLKAYVIPHVFLSLFHLCIPVCTVSEVHFLKLTYSLLVGGVSVPKLIVYVSVFQKSVVNPHSNRNTFLSS